MAEISIFEEPHYSRIADYVADGFKVKDYLHDHALKCDHCSNYYDDADDGFIYIRTGQWFCNPCKTDGEYKDSLTWEI